MADKTDYVDCLILTQQFESYWIPYWFSDGQLYSGPCRETARELTLRLHELAKKDPRLFNPDFSKIEAKDDLQGYFSGLAHLCYMVDLFSFGPLALGDVAEKYDKSSHVFGGMGRADLDVYGFAILAPMARCKTVMSMCK